MNKNSSLNCSGIENSEKVNLKTYQRNEEMRCEYYILKNFFIELLHRQ